MAMAPASHPAPGPAPREECRFCIHFRNDPAYLERTLSGMASLSSAYASVRGDDGVCLRHDRYLGAGFRCSDFQRWSEGA
jgi:hypothetical protein